MGFRKIYFAYLLLVGIVAVNTEKSQDKYLTNDISLNETTQNPDDSLRFHTRCGKNVKVVNDGRTAVRSNNEYTFATVLTNRPLRTNELFEVSLEELEDEWAGNLQIGVTIYSAENYEFDENADIDSEITGTWAILFDYVSYQGNVINEKYGTSLKELKIGDRVGVMCKDDGTLHLYVNGYGRGVAAQNVTEKVYGAVDLYGKASKISIVNH